MSQITQTHVGQINVVGECFCFGLALDGSQLVYLDIAGPATSVEAVWAKLVQNKECYCLPPQRNARSIALRSEEGKLKRLERKIEGISIYHLVLIHNDIIEPQYAELSNTYLFLNDKDQTTAKLGSHIQELVNIAVFPEWYPYLVQQGRIKKLLTRCACYGGVNLWKVTLDRDAWTRLICQGLNHSALKFPA